MEVMEFSEPNPPMLSVDAPAFICISWSLFKIEVIIDDNPTIIPAKSGARKVMFDFISETISASKSCSLSFILSIFFTYSDIDINERAATCNPFYADSRSILIEVAIKDEGNNVSAPLFLSNIADSKDIPDCWKFLVSFVLGLIELLCRMQSQQELRHQYDFLTEIES